MFTARYELKIKITAANTVHPSDMLCFRFITVNTLCKEN